MGSGGVAPMAATCLKPSEYRGDKNTAVAGRLVILTQQELPAKQPSQGHGQPKGKKASRARAPHLLRQRSYAR